MHYNWSNYFSFAAINISSDTLKILIVSVSFVVLLLIVFIVLRFLFRTLKKREAHKPRNLTVIILELLEIPLLWLIYWIILKIFSHIFLKDLPFFPALKHISTLLLIFSLAWISIKSIEALTFYMQSKLNIVSPNNLRARKSLTQIKLFKGIANFLIIFIAIAFSLLTFKEAKSIGVSLLTSAGIVGIIVGFAAQKSLGLILAGAQLAVTQPIRLDDVVVVEGEWGNIEEITLTYVIVKIWDQRRLILPTTYFLEKPFQNWTRSSSEIIGTVFLYVDYSFPVESLRKILPDMLKDNSNWDGRVWNVQVTNATDKSKEIRILLSSSDSSKNWDLRVEIREKLIDFINNQFPEAFPAIRIKQDNPAKPS